MRAKRNVTQCAVSVHWGCFVCPASLENTGDYKFQQSSRPVCWPPISGLRKRMHFVREKRDKPPTGARMRDVCG
jgi:hypothetical protein